MPGARKSRNSKEAIAKRERYGGRPANSRPPLPIVYIVCDDSRTAAAYFNLLKRQAKEHVTVHLLCVAGMPSDVILCARQKFDDLNADADNDAGDRQVVWALIDLESDYQRQQFAWQAKKDGEDAGINVALSLPCYEVWTLLHLIDTGQLFNDCGAVLVCLEAEWKKAFGQELGPKAKADFSKIFPARLDDAIERAKRQNPKNAQSWTEVYQAVEEILQFAQ